MHPKISTVEKSFMSKGRKGFFKVAKKPQSSKILAHFYFLFYYFLSGSQEFLG